MEKKKKKTHGPRRCPAACQRYLWSLALSSSEIPGDIRFCANSRNDLMESSRARLTAYNVRQNQRCNERHEWQIRVHIYEFPPKDASIPIDDYPEQSFQHEQTTQDKSKHTREWRAARGARGARGACAARGAGVTFTATCFPVVRLMARRTSPLVPWPIISRTSYRSCTRQGEGEARRAVASCSRQTAAGDKIGVQPLLFAC